MRIVIKDVNPIGAVRMTRRGKWTNPAAQRYLAYKEQLEIAMFAQLCSSSEKAFEKGEALRVVIVFKMQIPASSSVKVREKLMYTTHIKKPDIDNLIKGVFDSANGVLWADDNQVTSVAATKFYGLAPGIEIHIERAKGGE